MPLTVGAGGLVTAVAGRAPTRVIMTGVSTLHVSLPTVNFPRTLNPLAESEIPPTFSPMISSEDAGMVINPAAFTTLELTRTRVDAGMVTS